MKKLIVLFLVIFLLCSCSGGISNTTDNYNVIYPNERPSLLNGVDVTYDEEFTPQLDEYTVNEDFSNVINPGDISYLSQDAKEKLINNLFVIEESATNEEFINTYYLNSYHAIKIPSFITTDSAFHAFHLFYEYLQRVTEKNYLIDRIEKMSIELLNNSKEQLSLLRGTDWESAAQRNVDYFSVAVALCGNEEYEKSDRVLEELNLIENGNGIALSPIFSSEEEYLQDYSQFIVRGYYEDHEKLQKYFKVMMWFGQMTFLQKSNELSKSALLLNLALKDDALEDFLCVYEVTSFFAGEPDDNTYFEYYPIIEFYFGDTIELTDLTNKTDEFNEYLQYISELPKPQINSMVVSGYSDVEAETAGFRLLGQRYSLDSWIMENITFNKLKENSKGEARLLPDVLDVPAGLGSDLALHILNESSNATKWPEYNSQMEYIKNEVTNKGNDIYSKSVSSAWLGSLTKNLESKGKGWPRFMQSNAWDKKNLMTFMGGYTELCHDLILYTKRNQSGKGGGDPEVFKDDRGYVEPEPVIYHRLSSIIEATISGLQSYELISEDDATRLAKMKDTYDTLEEISRKELLNELPTDEEFDFIRQYYVFLGDIWEINTKEKSGREYVSWHDDEILREYPSFLVADVSTDSDHGLTLQVGNERPMTIYVAVYFDGQIRIARGVTYSSTQFTSPIENRLTDSKWRNIVHSNNREVIPPLPEWYDEVYSKNSNYTGSEFKGVEGMSLVEDDNANMLVVKANKINIRRYPSAKDSSVNLQTVEKGQKLEFYFTLKNEGYTWYYIGNGEWIADDGTWIEVLDYDKDIYDGWWGSFDKSKIKRIQILDEKMKVYSSAQQQQNVQEYVYSGDTLLVLDSAEYTNVQEIAWPRDFSLGYIWLKIGENKWIKVKDESQIAVLEGEPLDFSNFVDLTSGDDNNVHSFVDRGYIEIIYGPMYFRNSKNETITYQGKEYASVGEVYNIKTISKTNNEFWWAILDDDVYLFIGNIDELIVK